EDPLRAVAVVHVPVDDEQARDAVLVLQVAGRYRRVVEETEAHRAVGLRVVPRRPRRHERGPRPATGDDVAGRERSPGGEERRAPGTWRDAGVGIQAHRGLVARPADHPNVLLGMDARYPLDRTGVGAHLQEAIEEAGGLQVVPDRPDPLRALGMAGAVAVLEAILVVDEGDRKLGRAGHRPSRARTCSYRSNNSCAGITRTRSGLTASGNASISLS